ncbi:hypothetical protein H2204_010569 [Knufia peltigerae]|uniref:Major facilitator superfamily (MFS) profile domain-containing protein n=1 Tax=Knufia peltigerae TaxID=1002370 RepID=A0AA39CUS0_9EURO|nr:hypothetical protein H2204_010569 [Knufia peltigerae]
MLRERVALPEDKIQSYVSGLLAAYAGASVFCSIPVGIIADRTGARQLPFLCGLAALLAATLMLAFGNNILMLVIARLLQGTSAAVVWTVGLAMVLDTVGPENLGKVIGTIFSFISVGELMAPVLGGVLYRKTGYAGVFGLGCALLTVDFILRILVVEKKVAAEYDESFSVPKNLREYDTRNAGQDQDQSNEEGYVQGHANRDEDENADDGTSRPRTEHDLLLPKPRDDDDNSSRYAVPAGQNRLIRTLPILYCLTDARLLVALLMAFVQAALLASFDATIPTEAQSLFGFDSLQSGLLFIALDVPYLVLGPLAGWCVDRYGTKPASVLGFGYLVPTLVLLRLPPARLTANGTESNVVFLFCALLALNGVGLAVIGSPSIVEASDVVQRYDKGNPGLFGENGPYAQLYAFNSLVFSAGLTVGPILSGALRDSLGYGNMNVVVAAISAVTSILSFFFIGGGAPKSLNRSASISE